MGLQPNIKKANFVLKTCPLCRGQYGEEGFSPSKSLFSVDGFFEICNDCIKKKLIEDNFSWQIVNKICQHGDIPFVPNEFEKLRKWNGDDVFPVYAKVFFEQEYAAFDWTQYNNKFIELEKANQIEETVSTLKEEKYKQLRRKWGSNYDDDALLYLEELFHGIETAQGINSVMAQDQALKLCKISYEIDERIRSGQDIDKMLASYDKLVKIADFTPKNSSNINDFDTIGELIRWLEKGGWKNRYYDNVTRDVVDQTMKNIKAWNQRLYTNENSIGEEITKRIESLQHAEQIENNYDIEQEFVLDEFETEGYNGLFEEEDEFQTEVGESSV